MAPKISDLQAEMESTRAIMTHDIADMIENVDPNTESGKTLATVKDVIKSQNVHDARKQLEPKHPDEKIMTGLGAYLNKVKKEGEDQPLTGFKLHVHGEHGGHDKLLSPTEHAKYHKSLTNFYLNTEKNFYRSFLDCAKNEYGTCIFRYIE